MTNEPITKGDYMKVRKAIIPAAGLGTRFLPATKAVPKEMLPIVDKPTLQYIVEECVAAGITDILIIIGRNKVTIEDHFDKSYELETELAKKNKQDELDDLEAIWRNVNIHFVRQKEPKGLGHAIACGETFVGDEPFAVLLGDDVVYNPDYPCIKQLMDEYDKTGASVLGVQSVPRDQVNKYGIVAGEKINERVMNVTGLVEKPDVDDAPSNQAILGRYIISPTIFEILKTTKPGKGGEIQITDALLRLSKKEPVLSYDFSGRRYDVGDKQGFIEATIEYALRDEKLKDGVTKYLKAIHEKL